METFLVYFLVLVIAIMISNKFIFKVKTLEQLLIYNLILIAWYVMLIFVFAKVLG